MLVLNRKHEETIRIGDDITITVCRIGQGEVKIGVDAPDDVEIWRGEIYAERRARREEKAVRT